MFIYVAEDREPSATTAPRRRRWHAAAIVPGPAACAAAGACRDRRYLSDEAPRLPLAACDAAHCECVYRKFDDRRRSLRRSELKKSLTRALGGTERRQSRDRRAPE